MRSSADRRRADQTDRAVHNPSARVSAAGFEDSATGSVRVRVLNVT
jgi:hypothetical protein